MANENNEVSKTSIEDIAASLLIPKVPVGTQVDEDVVERDEVDPQLDTEGLPPEGSEYNDGEEVVEEADEDEVTADDDTTVIDIMDDDLIDVMIDGVLEQRTIGELKKALSGEGAIEKRLQEATETRKAAHSERTSMLEKLASNERIFVEALSSLDSSLFKGVIPAPNEAMRQSNPETYIRHKEAYEADQKRVADAKNAIAENIKKVSAQRDTRLKEYGEAAATRIAELIPELTDPTKSTPVLQDLMTTAKAYGYTDQEIGSALDPRMFHLVRDAMRYRALLDSGKNKKMVDLSGEKNKPIVRKLRSGGTKAKSFVAARAKEQAQVAATARSSGKVNDVAATLLVSRPKR